MINIKTKDANDLKTLYPDVAAEWDYNRNEKKPEDYRPKSNEKVYWKCPECGESYPARIASRTSGSGCPCCSGQKVKIGVNDLKTLFPEVAAEWDYNRNEKNPEDYRAKSNKKVYWKCPKCGESYPAIIGNRTKGTGCPCCSGQKVKIGVNDLRTLYPNVAAQWDNNRNEKKPEDYKYGSSAKVYWICPECGESYRATIAHRTRGTGCPYCSGRKVKTGINDLKTLFPDVAAEWDYKKNEKNPEDYTRGSTAKVYWICPECGESYRATIAHRTRGSGCPCCSGRKVKIGYNDLKTMFPDVAAEWDYKKNEKKPENYTYGSSVEVYWNCPKCGESYLATINSRTRGTGTGCPYCSGQKVKIGYNDLKTLFPDVAAEWDYKRNESNPENYTRASNAKVYWNCPKCGKSYPAVIANRTKGSGCPHCCGNKCIAGVNDLATLYPKIASEWDYEENGDLKPSDVLPFSNKTVHWIYEKNGCKCRFTDKIANRVKKNGRHNKINYKRKGRLI